MSTTVTEKSFLWVDYLRLVMLSCYISPNITIEAFGITMDQLKISIGLPSRKCKLAGDFNAKSNIWGSNVNNKRGEISL